MKNSTKSKILTTYRISDCPLWDSRVTFLDHIPGNGRVKSGAFRGIGRALDDLSVILKLLKEREKYDVLITNSDRPSNLFAVFQSIFGKKIRHIMLNCLWGIPANRGALMFRKWFYGALNRATDRFIVFARSEIDNYNKAFGIPKEKFVYIPFYFTPKALDHAPEEGDYIFSGGHPHYRDYETLLEAVKELDAPCKIAVQAPEYFAGKTLPANVEVCSLAADQYFECLAKSKLVIIPLKEKMIRASGQRSYLDAMILGKLVIVCDKLGASDYISNREEGVIVPPGDPQALKDAIKWALDPENGQKVKEMSARVREKARAFSIENTMGQVLSLAEKTTGERF